MEKILPVYIDAEHIYLHMVPIFACCHTRNNKHKVSPCKLELAEEIASWTVETIATSPDTEIETEFPPDTVIATVETVQCEPVESENLESIPDMVTEVVTETVRTLEPATSSSVIAQSVPLSNIETQSVPLTNIKAVRMTRSEARAAAFETSVIDSRVSPFRESTSTLTESTSLSFADSAHCSDMESTPSTYRDPMTNAYSESRLQEAELVINLSARRRRSLKNPTLTQVNTSIAGSENYAPSLADPRSNMSISDSFVSTMTSLNETSTSIDVQTDNEAVETVSSSEHDPLLEDNTVAIMGQVTTSNTVLLNENSETGKNEEETDAVNEIDPNNVIVISMIDADEEENKAENNASQKGEPTPDEIVIPSSSKRQEPVPTSILVNQHLQKPPDEPEITIERKKVHVCLVCKAKFKSIMDLFRHRVEHNEDMKSTFKCHMCDHVCNSPVDLEKHRMTVHSANKLYKCSICQDTFNILHNYKCHLRIHNSVGPYVCNMCYRVFDKKKHFISHMDDHEFAATNPYRHRLQCNTCDKIFSEDGKLQRHMLTHSGKRNHICELCGKGFLERHKLNRHMLTHTGKREYQCPDCDKSFSLKHNLTIHMRIHANIRPYQCLVCKRTFIQKVVLQRHLRIHQDYLQEQSHKFSQKYVN